MAVKHYIAGGAAYEAFAAFDADFGRYIGRADPTPLREPIWRALGLNPSSADIFEPIEWTLDHDNRLALLSTTLSLSGSGATEILGSELEAATKAAKE